MTVQLRTTPIARPLNLGALADDDALLELVGQRKRDRKMSAGEWRALSHWLRLRRRHFCGEHRRREMAEARRRLILEIQITSARHAFRKMVSPINAALRGVAAATAAMERFAEAMRPYASPAIGRRVLFELQAGRRLERHFELGGGV